MLLYNVTIGIDAGVEDEWVQWMKQKHIPEVLSTGMFVDSKMYKILNTDDEGTISYSIQYFALSIEHVQQYLEIFAPKLIEEHREKFKDKHVAFRTLLQEV